MKNLLVVFLVICLCPFIHAQSDSLPEPEPYFSALIVANIDSSIIWYSNVLGYEIVDKKEYEGAGFKQANLKRAHSQIELIELNSAISLREAIPNYNPKTRTHGIFKMGFQVPQFDRWIQHVSDNKVRVHGNVVEDPLSGKRMVIILDPDGNRIQLFEK